MSSSLQAFVLPGAGSEDVKVWLESYASAEIVNNMKHANLVVFTGGADVGPRLYGELNVASHSDPSRDKDEMVVFDFCRSVGMPMFGICRGAQFLHVGMGGKLWQDVGNHCCQHSIIDLDSGVTIPDTTSTHHQMVREAWCRYADAGEAGFTLVATPDLSRSLYYQSASECLQPADNSICEVEAYRYSREGTSIMAIQGHPEWGGEEFAMWAGDKLSDWHESL